MNHFKQASLTISGLLLSGALFATSCPQVGNYTVKSHDANNRHCSYVSNATVKKVLGPPQATRCPRFVLTDPNFNFVSCSHSLLLSKCVCKIVSR